MADKKFTLLELNLGDGTIQIGPATLGEGSSDEAEPAPDDSDPADDETSGGCGCPGKKAGKLLAVVLVLALVALAAKKLLGGSVEDLDELEDLADLDEE
mgnify:CR=1 FL=1